MPTVSIGRDLLFEALGKSYTEEEFDELCFEFGIELDDVTTEKAIIEKETKVADADASDEVIYKIEVPANRYDLLCLEGLARALNIFLCKERVPQYRLADLKGREPERMVVKAETALIRPFVICAILRGITFDKERYDSFIDLQDKLHQNLCRRRTLVAIGTHDLDTLQGPFTYEALPPSDIKFVPLKQTKEFTAEGLMEFYKSDNKLKKFLHIINDSPVFPVIYDSNRTVLSLPPIINGAHSAISLATKNVLIECTATDVTKASTVLNTVVTMFSSYCSTPFEVEPVEVVDAVGTSRLYPDLSSRPMDTPAEYLTRTVGIELETPKVVELLNRMQLVTEDSGDGLLRVLVPPTRADVLHPCDVAEDLAIAYGYNNIVKTIPKSATIGKEQPLNQFSDLLRLEAAMAGFMEVLTWVLLSRRENFAQLRREDDGKTAVSIGNPRGEDFEMVRSSLLPGLLKTVGANKEAALPVKLFELSDTARLDPTSDVGARNERHLAALYCNLGSGFEVIHGFVNRVMEAVGVPLVQTGSPEGYYIEPSEDPTFFSGRQARIVCRGRHLGVFGIVHPEVLQKFEISNPCAALEMDIESLLGWPELASTSADGQPEDREFHGKVL